MDFEFFWCLILFINDVRAIPDFLVLTRLSKLEFNLESIDKLRDLSWLPSALESVDFNELFWDNASSLSSKNGEFWTLKLGTETE